MCVEHDCSGCEPCIVHSRGKAQLCYWCTIDTRSGKGWTHIRWRLLPPNLKLANLLIESMTHLSLFFQICKMAFSPIHFGTLVELEVEVTDISDVGKGQTFRRVTTHVMVDEGLDNPVPCTYMPWYMWTNGELFSLYRGFNRPFGELLFLHLGKPQTMPRWPA